MESGRRSISTITAIEIAKLHRGDEKRIAVGNVHEYEPTFGIGDLPGLVSGSKHYTSEDDNDVREANLWRRQRTPLMAPLGSCAGAVCCAAPDPDIAMQTGAIQRVVQP
jgi:hypothetical protein